MTTNRFIFIVELLTPGGYFTTLPYSLSIRNKTESSSLPAALATLTDLTS